MILALKLIGFPIKDKIILCVSLLLSVNLLLNIYPKIVKFCNELNL